MLAVSHLLLCGFAAIAILFAGCSQEKPDTRAEIFVTSVPDIATVFVNGKESGLTPLRFKAPPDTYILEIEKAGYKTAFCRITCEAMKERNVEIQLEPLSAAVMLISDPPGSIVTKDGAQIGQTPTILRDCPLGKHAATLSKAGFVSQEIQWTVEDSRPMKQTGRLASNIGELSVDSSPKGADVTVDGKFIGKTPVSERFEPGVKELVVRLSGHSVFEQKVTVERDAVREVHAELSILPGRLIVKTSPSGATVTVNNEFSKESPAEFADLKPGTYSVKVQKTNFDPEEREAIVSPGRDTELLFEISSNQGEIHISANPPGVTIFLDGKKIGSTVPDQNKSISKIFEIRGVSSGKHTVTVSHHRAVPNEISFTVVVPKGKTASPKPVTMWIADTYLKLKNGREMNGRLRQENEEFIIFEPEPSIHIQYRRDEIDVLKKMLVE